MKAISFNLHYNIIEFNFLTTQINNKFISVLELLIDCEIDEFNENDFTGIFIIETDNLTYVFDGFEVNEFYEENGFLKVVCVK